MKILMLDGSCPQPYSTATLRTEAIGGSEASVIRVADALGAFVCQHNRTASEGRYLRLADALARSFDAVISVRLAASVALAARSWPGARHLLWLHDLEPPKLLDRRKVLEEAEAVVVCVSDFHARHVHRQLEQGVAAPTRIVRIYNPIDDDLHADGTPVDRNKLIFFSSPVKGLEDTLRIFEQLHAEAPEMRLYVANPGYFADRKTAVPGVVELGALPHAAVIRHVRESLCVFYPNTVFPETFGLVYAEANAVGTPVIAHDFGAAREVLGAGEQVTNAGDVRGFIERVMEWRRGKRPVVAPNPAFRLAVLVQEWRALLA
jgi:glycosyltransferase involved in cell wall biosynthesis